MGDEGVIDGFRLVLYVEPPGEHPRAPRGAVWRQRSDDELFWIMTVLRRSAEAALLSHALAALAMDQALGFLPVGLIPPQPGMAVFWWDGRVADQYQDELSANAIREMARIGAGLIRRHRPYLDALAQLFATGEPSDGTSHVPRGHPLWRQDSEGIAFFAPTPPPIEVRGRRSDYQRE